MKQNKKSVSPNSNQVRNSYVTECLTRSLLKLLEEKPMNDISISELCDFAEIGRVSFYRNFESKDEIIQRHLNLLLDEWLKQYNAKQESGEDTVRSFVETFFEHYHKHKELYILLYKRGLAHLSLQSIKEACGPKPEQPNIAAYTTAYLSYGLYGWIEEWFKRGMQESPAEMAELWKRAQDKA